MNKDQYKEVLEILNFESTRKEMVILGALLKSQNEPTAFVDFEAIRSQLAIEEGGKKGKDPLIYRGLSGLEKTGFIQVDRSEHKHGYNTDVGLMHEVFRKAINKAISKLENELHLIDTEIEQLSKIDIEELSTDMISLAAGKQKIEKPVFAEGWENVIQLIEDKIYTYAKKGDLVRFSLEWLSRSDMITPIRADRLGRLMDEGVIFLGLEHNKISKQQRELFKRFTLAYREQGFNPGFRICERQDSTYQFVGRNDEGIVLIVSENPMSATWIPRNANPDLVDNAIESFDTDYDVGEDITDIGGD
ncbi:hypothetical protein EU528_01245 [Candidatus Thorarchaeota archaeon]|nr:MAG: hypothetical protein EU528_01245 [Candidatus Thorarchaeota archaeon]